MVPIEEVEFVDDDVGLEEGVVAGLAELGVWVRVGLHRVAGVCFCGENVLCVLLKLFVFCVFHRSFDEFCGVFFHL